MDINAYIQERLQEEKENLEKSQRVAEERISQARLQLETLKARTDLPEKTDTLAKLQKASGKTVLLEDAYGREETSFEFKGGRINTKGVSYPLIGSKGQGVKKMIDKESGEIIFNNPYYNEEVSLQYAMLLGREAGLEEAQIEIDSAIKSKEYWQESFKETQEAFAKVPEWIEKGEQFIYPQRHDKWQECVAKRASDLYKGSDLENALAIMESLANGGSVEEAKNILDAANHSGMSHAVTMSIVASFSKRGPEFYREVEQNNPEWLQNIERENKSFERELSSGGKG